MRIKKIAAQCVAARRMTLWDHVDRDGVMQQWITNGFAAWPLCGLPQLDEAHLPVVFDLTDKQVENMIFRHDNAPETIDFADAIAGEALASAAPVRIRWGDGVLQPVTAGGRTWMLDTDYLAPVTAEYDDFDYYLRHTPDGRPYFALKNGLLIVGIVMPMDNMDALAEKLAEIAEQLRWAKPEALPAADEARACARKRREYQPGRAETTSAATWAEEEEE